MSRHAVETEMLEVSFPTLPSTIEEVEELVGSGQTAPEKLIEIVKQCPSTSLNVLRRANSAYYGLRHEVESVEQAVRLLGFVEVTSIVVLEGANKMREQLTNHTGLLDRIMHASIFTGRFTQQLTRQLDLAGDWVRLAFSVGLLHVMGRLVLLYSAPDQYAPLFDERDSPLPEVEDERHLFGESHRSLAHRAGEHWSLSDRICSVLRGAIDLSGPSTGRPQTVAVTVRVGSALAQQDLTGESLTLPEGLPTAETSLSEELVAVAADDATDYAANLGVF
ncbi:HDOD domain-containing protein [Salinibacter grassmerensis]|uniref:HDOD domain-containing protein n=1 Tax=Salinibacter grassmerensis TaxID=3040353 RepID=UPI0021E99691|nr:HDOD domain-containing protein [Salinibacter grassmerensis]